MLWLKRCVVPIEPKEALFVGVVYLAVLLAYGRPFSLLPAIVCGTHNGLRVLTEKFCKVKEVLNKEGSSKTKIPNPHIELPYTYIMAWFILHCPILMSQIHSQMDYSSPIVQHYERSQWKGHYMAMIC